MFVADGGGTGLRGAKVNRINAFGRRSLGNVPIGCLVDFSVNEKRLCIGFGLAEPMLRDHALAPTLAPYE
jgi:hypothetical protein